MDRRFLTVLGVSLVFALVVSSIFYQMTARAGNPTKVSDKSDQKDMVVAAKPLVVGSSIKPGDVKVVRTAVDQFPRGAFSKVEEVMDRPIMKEILLDEPVVEGRLAARGSGPGIAPIIPPGMRAVSVRVTEVVGVAGFVLPGMRVDVLVTGRPPEGSGTMTKTVLQNITVLSAGQVYQQDSKGQAINANSVTVVVTPEQAEILTLASLEGRIQLVLRNGADSEIATTNGRDTNELFGGQRPKQRANRARFGGAAGEGYVPEESEEDDPRPVPRRARKADPPPVVVAAPPPPPPPDEIVSFRGTVKTVEAVGPKK